jgi:SlyX protein
MPEERIRHLEERLAWFERHVMEQDKVMLGFSRDLERALAEVRLLRDRVAATAGDAAGAAGSAAQERPPHY